MPAKPNVTRTTEDEMEKISADIAQMDGHRIQPTLLPPGMFHPGDDLDLWSFRIKAFLLSVPPEQHGQFILSRLDDSAARRVLHSGLSLTAPPDILWTQLTSLFGTLPPSSVFRERFFNRNQHPGETADEYADALRDLASKAYPEDSPKAREVHAAQRFMAGVRNAELKAKFRRKGDRTLGDALQIARTYEHLYDSGDTTPIPTPVFSKTQRHRQDIWIPTESKPNPRNCFYCMRFGKNARRCGHNSHNIKSPLSTSAPTASTRQPSPLIIIGQLNSKPVSILVDTGASRSIVSIDLLRPKVNSSHNCPELLTADGSIISSLGVNRAVLSLSDIITNFTFICARINWDVIVGMDFLVMHGAHIDAQAGTVRFSKSECNSTSSVDTNKLRDLRSNIPDTERSSVINLLMEFYTVLDISRPSLGRTNVLRHAINTGGHKPIRIPPRRVPIHYQGELDSLLSEMLKKKIIRPSSSPWSSPIVLVRKKDGSLRICVDYRQLNQITERDSFPIPRVDDTIDAVAGSKWFSTLDLASGYWQVEVHPKDRCKTAFAVPSGLYEFETMPFGLANAPATFQRLMQTVLAGLVPKCCLIYLDDIIIHGRTIDEHNGRLREVLCRLKEAGLTLRAEKCKFLQRKVLFLGHILSSDGVQTDPDKTKHIAEWPTPTGIRDLRSFLGLASYYRRFTKGFAAISASLHKLTHENRKFLWTVECDEAFNRLKQALTSPPILAYPNLSPDAGEFVLDTDASEMAIGAVLSQCFGDREVVIAYGSRVLDKRERNYCTTRREMLALVYFLHHFRPYLLARHFLVRTDHHSLQWLQSFRDPDGQVARWQERIQEYAFTCIYRPGARHSNADALSRRPVQKLESVNVLLASNRINWEEEQLRDTDIGEIYRIQLQGHSKPSGRLMASRSSAARSLWSRWGQLRIISRVLHLMDSRDGQPRVVVPRSRVQQTIAAVHRDLGHAGQKKTEAHIRRHYWWFLLHHDVADFCRHCTVCAKTKTPTVTPRAPLQPIPVQGPNHRVGIDVIGPLPETRNGNRFIVVMTDYLTKWCEAVPVKQQDARTIASVIISEWVSRYGVPVILHSDQGPAFESYLLRETCALLEIHKTRTTPYHPEGNGLVERTNRTIKKTLTTLVDRYEEDRWDEHIPLCMLAYRAAVHESTGYAPAFLQLGHDLRLPSDAETPVAPADLVGSNEYVRSLRERLFAALQIARENIGHAQQHQKTVYDRRSNGPVYEVGDHVLLHRPKAPPGAPAKFHQTWQGLYVIIMKRPNNTYVIRDPSQPHTDVQCVHYNQLKPFPQHRNDAQPSTSHYLPPVSHTVEITTSDTNTF